MFFLRKTGFVAHAKHVENWYSEEESRCRGHRGGKDWRDGRRWITPAEHRRWRHVRFTLFPALSVYTVHESGWRSSTASYVLTWSCSGTVLWESPWDDLREQVQVQISPNLLWYQAQTSIAKLFYYKRSTTLLYRLGANSLKFLICRAPKMTQYHC